MTLDEAKRLLKHGYWIEEEPRVLKCSVCGEYAPMNYLGQNCIDSRYCPWCGTKMDSNADEPWQSE
jgi:Zn finger protein HypA/HybF involved in hydrogenase expression